MLDSQVDETVSDIFRILSQSTDRLGLSHIVEFGHQRSVEIFREKYKVTLISGHRIDEKLHLLKHVIQCLIGTHLPLYQPYSDCGLLVNVRIRRRLIVNIIPLQQRSAVLGFLVVRQVITHHTTYVEIIRKLEGQHRIVDFARTDLLDVLLRTHLVGIFVIVRNTSTEHDGFQVQFFTQLLAVFIHSAGQTQSPVFGMDKHFNTIKDISFRVVCTESLISCHLRIRVVSLDQIIIHDDRKCASHNLVIHDGYNLSFGENTNQFFYLCMCPEHILVCINTSKRLGKLCIVFNLQISKLYLVNLLLSRFHNLTNFVRYFSRAQK